MNSDDYDDSLFKRNKNNDITQEYKKIDKNEGSFALGFILSLFFSSFIIWLIALVSGKKATRKGAFWCFFLQLILVIYILFRYGILIL